MEAGLVFLESVCEDEDLCKAKLLDAQNLARYKLNRRNELEQLKGKKVF